MASTFSAMSTERDRVCWNLGQQIPLALQCGLCAWAVVHRRDRWLVSISEPEKNPGWRRWSALRLNPAGSRERFAQVDVRISRPVCGEGKSTKKDLVETPFADHFRAGRRNDVVGGGGPQRPGLLRSDIQVSTCPVPGATGLRRRLRSRGPSRSHPAHSTARAMTSPVSRGFCAGLRFGFAVILAVEHAGNPAAGKGARRNPGGGFLQRGLLPQPLHPEQKASRAGGSEVLRAFRSERKLLRPSSQARRREHAADLGELFAVSYSKEKRRVAAQANS